MRLVRFVLDNALLIHLLTFILIAVGIFEGLKLRREAFPAVDFDIVTIMTYYPGATPLEVELYVSDPIEEEVGKISGIKELSSLSAEGFSLVSAQLDPDLDERIKDRTINDIQRAVDRVQNLPEELPDRPLVRSIESGDMPVIEVSLSLPDDYDTLHRLADQLSERLRLIPDVESIEKRGWEEREFWVEVDPRAMRRYQIGLDQVIGLLGLRNFNLPGGAIETAEGELLVRTIGEVTTVTGIENIVLRTNDAGVTLRIGDIARVRSTYEERTRVYRTNGAESINLQVTKNARGDILDLVDSVKREVGEFELSHGVPGLEVAYVNDFSFFVRNRLGVLTTNGMFGIGFVLIVLLLMLSKSIAVVTAIGLPIAFIGTFAIMVWAGLTVNLISMFGMIIVLGLIVDDAIIVAENIWQHYEMGKSPRDAVVDGTSEVLYPVLATILTTAAAFSPMLMMTGIFGKFIAELPMVVIAALGMSYVEAMLILPLHAWDVLRFREARGRAKARRGIEVRPPRPRLLDRFTDTYAAFLRWSLRLRYLFLVGIIGLFGFSLWWAGNKMSFILFPASGIEAFFLRADQPIGTSLERTAERFRVLEERLAAELPPEELQDFVLYVGVQQNDPNDPFTQRGSHLGQIVVFLTPANQRERTAQEVIEALREPLAEAAKAGGFEQIGFEMQRPGPPVGKPVSVRVQGQNFDAMNAVADRLMAVLAETPHVSDISKDFTRGKDELVVVIDELATARAGLSVQQVALQVRAALAGQIATWVRRDGERIAIRVRLPEEERNRVGNLSELRIPNQFGVLVPLGSVAHLEKRPGLTQIIRRDERRTITVSASVDEQRSSSQAVNQGLLATLAQIEREHDGITLSPGGEYEDTAESMESLQSSFVIALALIFMILTTQFRSISQPIIVMSVIPFGIIGVIWSFYLHGEPISFIGMVGMIGLSGVIVNGSIVLVDFLNKARERGKSVFDAAVEAGRRRFRAVWLTTMTTVVGLVPLVYGIGGEDKFLAPAAIALGYGLAFGTVLVLFFVPVIYLIGHDFGRMFRWVLGRFVDLGPEAGEKGNGTSTA